MKNAIERRLARIIELWNGFAQTPGLRLLCWRGDADELRLVDAMVEVEAEQPATPDLFLRLTSPFTDPSGYAAALLKELEAQYEASREGLREQGLAAGWRPPAAVTGEADGLRLLHAASDLQATYGDRCELLVLCLAPERIEDPAGWRRWLERLGGSQIPATLRFMVGDPIAAPLLGGLDEALPDRVAVIEPRLDMPAAMEELARSEGKDGPAKDYRIHFLGLANAAGKGNLPAAEKSAGKALGVAGKEGWLDQEVAVHLALGAARLGRQAFAPAADSYRKAIEAARRAKAAGHPAGARLEMTAGMGLGGALLAAGQWPEAARVYAAVAPLAAAAGDRFTTLEAWRMAAYCHEQAGADAEAWRCADRALDVGSSLAEEERRSSTLPWVGLTLLRLLERHYKEGDHAMAMRARLDRLLGEGWAERIPGGSAAA
jgi:tetratricopeptide (TPR) repeat protein